MGTIKLAVNFADYFGFLNRRSANLDHLRGGYGLHL